MRLPNKPHREGYEDEEDCEGHYDPDEAERRRCHQVRGQSPLSLCGRCFNKWQAEEKARRQAAWDGKTPEEKASHEALVRGLRELL